MKLMKNIAACPDEQILAEFKDALYYNEKAKATVDKYMRSMERLSKFLNGRNITKELLIEYREELLKTRMAQTVNGDLSAINAYLEHRGLSGIRIRLLKVQRQPFLEESKELSKEEYKRLLDAVKDAEDERMYLLLLTLGSTGIRIGELCYITAEAVNTGRPRYIYFKRKKLQKATNI